MKQGKILLAILLAAAMVMSSGMAAPAAEPDPNPPVGNNTTPVRNGTGSGEPTEDASGEATGETSGEEPLPLVAGTYEGSDGSVLNVKEDGTCTYETLVSGKVNGKPMSGRLTFHGTVDGGVFRFEKVTFFGLDLTAMAASAGYTDASYWETAAGIIYADALRD